MTENGPPGVRTPMRLALYAHYNTRPLVARHVLYYVEQLHHVGFQICFISNSPLSAASENALLACCRRIIQRENVGFDFSMWQQALAGYDLAHIDELLLTNSSIIGPLRPLEPLWESPLIDRCDFWGLTDNCELSAHLQSYFLVFRRRVVASECFARFWAAVLPYAEKDQVIRNYEVGLTRWLDQHGFTWAPLFPREAIRRLYRQRYSLPHRIRDRLDKRGLPGANTTLRYPQILIEAGMPFLKAALLQPGNRYLQPEAAWSLLRASALPREILEQLRGNESMTR